ncbi:hydrogenase maturation protease [Paucibacter sp. KBW04]|uniref:hydrogenase maturation protease n=1 Tax=Paucibacter sp. KBW04 TaxID=2153361 RepID=UPI000F5626BE|nr:hydrogenase maturation protease [Paucibacter sp. KBW04]RQO60606.1 hydrogenase maturation protease [Paucibacter sp. KBW04]
MPFIPSQPCLSEPRHLLCLGNALHGDDGLGPALAQALLAAPQLLPADVRVYEVGTRGLDALALFEGCRQVLLIDASEPRGQPGRIWQGSAADLLSQWQVLFDSAPTDHGGGLGFLLRAAASLEGAPEVEVILLEAQQLRAFSPGLSAAVQAAMPALIARVQAALEPAYVV